MKIFKKYSIAIISALFLFTGCGGGGSSSNEATSTSTEVDGILIDSPISNVDYTCGDVTATTGAGGEFTCKAGTTISFNIGGVKLGSFTIANNTSFITITPADLTGVDISDVSNMKLIKFISFIQALDSDGNPDNGIDIDAIAKSELRDVNISINDDTVTLSDINTTLNAKCSKSIPNKKEALEHYLKGLSDAGIETIKEPLFKYQWNLKVSKEMEDEGIDKDASIHAGNILSLYSGKGVKVAIIEVNAFDIYHPELYTDNTYWYNANTQDANMSVPDPTTLSHATAVASVLMARKNGIGMIGVASDATALFIEGKDLVTESDEVSWFDTAANQFGADIINCSFGTDISTETTLQNLLTDLTTNGRNGKGVVIVVSAGNDSSAIQPGQLASRDDLIVVGATDEYNSRAQYSNYGASVDIVAPAGYYVGTLVADQTGSAGVATELSDYILPFDPEGVTGTSLSAPIVSGVIALMLEKNPNLTLSQIDSILKNSADKIGNRSYAGGRNDYYGYGKINLEKIMAAIN